MCRTQCVLVLAALYMGSAHSSTWDFAAVSSGQIEFYTNGSKTQSVKIPLIAVTCNFYDEVSNKMFMDLGFEILSCDIATKKIETAVHFKNEYEHNDILDIAFDPVEQILFWVERMRNIKWFSLKPGSKNDLDGNFLFKLQAGDKPLAIAVDSCKRYIYWSSAKLRWYKNKFTSTIERARLDGSKREVVISNIRLPLRNCLVIDQQALKLYWIVKEPLEVYSIERADLNGDNKEIHFTGTKAEPSVLTISKGYIYWSFWDLDPALQLPTIRSKHAELKEISIGPSRKLANSNNIDDQIEGCEELRELFSNNGNAMEGNVSTNIASDVSVCQNYCFKGDCTVTTEGVPKCRCNNGYSGERCEINMCQSYCLNDGVCSLNKNRQPICQCNENYGGERCDVSVFLRKCFQTVTMLKDIFNADVASVTFGKETKSTCDETVF